MYFWHKAEEREVEGFLPRLYNIMIKLTHKLLEEKR
jgi:hypothetical protein